MLRLVAGNELEEAVVEVGEGGALLEDVYGDSKKRVEEKRC